MEKIFQANGKEKRVCVARLILDKIDFKTKTIQRDPEGHFIILKGRIHQEDMNIIGIYAPNIGAPKYIRKILEDFKKEIDSNKLIVGFFFKNTLPKMDRSFKKYIKKYIVELKDTLDQMDLTDIYIQKLSSQRSKIHIPFKAQGTLSKVHHKIGHKTSLNKFKKIDIISHIFLDTKGLKLQTNLKEKTHRNSY